MDKCNPRVLLVSVSPDNAVGGIATWTRNYISYCLENNVQYNLIDTSKINNVQNGGIVKELQRTFRILRDLRSSLSKEQYDIAHINTSIGFLGIIRDYIIAKTIFRHGLPIVVQFHCDIPFWDRNPAVGFFLSRILKTSNLNFVLCNSSKKHLKVKYGTASELVPNFIDFIVKEEPKKINNSIERIIYSGRVSIAKGIPEILEAAKAFPSISFLLVGNVLPEISSYEIPQNVSFTGQIEHSALLEMLDNSDVFLFPSHSEGFSIALTEAMAKGLPCIVSNVGANTDMVSDGAGISVPVGDTAAIVHAICELEKSDVRLVMSQRAKQKVLTNYTRDPVMNRIFELYTRVSANE